MEINASEAQAAKNRIRLARQEARDQPIDLISRRIAPLGHREP